MDANQIWQAALERIRPRVSPGAFATWFRDTLGLELSGEQLLIGVGNTFASEHLTRRFQETTRVAVSEALGRSTQIRFVVRSAAPMSGSVSGPAPATSGATDAADRPAPRRPNARRGGVRANATARTSALAPLGVRRATGGASRTGWPAQPMLTGLAAMPQAGGSALPVSPAPIVAHPYPEARPAARDDAHAPIMPLGSRADGLHELHDLHPRYCFETFVVGTANRLAYAAAEEVARAPGASYNPLLLYGGVGLGKTHLLHAIGHRARAAGLAVAYVTAERFTNEIIEAIRLRTTNEFRRRYRTVDVLLVDDIQFIAGKDSTEEEFFHTFNTLHEANKQIVLSSDRVPSAMRHLHDRLRSRFAWGLIADVLPPDYEHRLEILRAKAPRAELPEEVLEYLARPACESIRALEGALTRVLAHARMLGQPPDIATAVRALAPLAGERSAPRPIEGAEVVAAVARHFGIGAESLRGKSRERQAAWARQVAMYLLRELTPASLAQIGALLGGRDHTTIMHGCARVGEALGHDAGARSDLEAVHSLLRA